MKKYIIHIVAIIAIILLAIVTYLYLGAREVSVPEIPDMSETLNNMGEGNAAQIINTVKEVH
ncbi:MAG: hypothetical protein U9P50_01615 [Patescibacteria group bacterium]|nr:hypothetical protein [Patescibacteria group bacterium]